MDQRTFDVRSRRVDGGVELEASRPGHGARSYWIDPVDDGYQLNATHRCGGESIGPVVPRHEAIDAMIAALARTGGTGFIADATA